jgi:DNA-binding NarL/FixJ family response regulator
VRVVIAEDQLLLREGLSRLLRDNEFDVVAAVGDAGHLMASVAEHRPALAVVDIRLPPAFKDEGLRAALEIRSAFPETAILILSQYVEQAYAAELLADGGGRVGYLLKDRVFDVDEFVESVRRVGAGGTALDPQVVAQLVSRHRQGSPLDGLSPRERDVLGLMAEGRSNPGIAGALVLTIGAVEKHIASIFTKLDLPPSDGDNRRVLAVLAYLQQDRPLGTGP